VWGLIRGLHPRLLNLLPSGERAAAPVGLTPEDGQGSDVWSTVIMAGP
jgi:hypothetical protein